jgi:hypothetical protein
MEVVDDPSQIIVDVAICLYDKEVPQYDESEKTLGNFLHSFMLKKYYVGMNSLEEVKRLNPDVTIRHVFDEGLGDYGRLKHVMDYSPEITWQLQLDGRRKAKEALENLK